MARTSCPNCGAKVDVAEDVDTGENVAVELFTEPPGVPPRYRFVGHNPLRVKKVDTRAPGDHFPAHWFDCPAHNAGR